MEGGQKVLTQMGPHFEKTNFEGCFFFWGGGKHLMNAQGVLIVPGAVVGNYWYGDYKDFSAP